MTEQRQRLVKPGEMLAMKETSLHQGTQSFFWMMGNGSKPNERIGDVAIVHVRGELEHHADAWGGCESYEGILDRMSAAITGECAPEASDGAEVVETENDPPSTVIMCIDSPGGVVSGLNETVKAIQKLRAANPDVKVVAFCNEMAASAAYALACSCEEIICPPSAIIGSIGVISTVISQAAKNKRDGYDVRLLTSGARKADGHIHAPISDAAVDAEMGRVNDLAKSFWTLASKARGVPVETIQSFQAGIFLGPKAKKRGLVDAVMSFDDVLLGASLESNNGEATKATGGNETDRREKKSLDVQNKSSSLVSKSGVTLSVTPALKGPAMSIQLSALIKKTEAKIATEKDPKKLASLLSALDAYKKTKKHIEHTETEEAPDDDDDDETDDNKDDEDDSDEDESKKSEEKSEDEEKKAKAPMGEEDDEEDEESEEKSAKAALALVKSFTGMTGRKSLGAARALFETAANTAKDVAALKKASLGAEKSALIKENTGKYLTRKEAAWLGTQKLSTVQGFVEMRHKAGVIVNTDESTLIKPKHVQPGTEESLPKETLEMIEQACSSAGEGVDKKTLRETLVKNHLAAHNKHLSEALNGAVGRF